MRTTNNTAANMAAKLAKAEKANQAKAIKEAKEKRREASKAVDYKLTVIASDQEYKEMSLFRVLDFINSPKVSERFGLKEALTIDDLKALAPDYFTRTLKDGTTEPRKSFAPHTFLVALRNQIINAMCQ